MLLFSAWWEDTNYQFTTIIKQKELVNKPVESDIRVKPNSNFPTYFDILKQFVKSRLPNYISKFRVSHRDPVIVSIGFTFSWPKTPLMHKTKWLCSFNKCLRLRRREEIWYLNFLKEIGM